MKLAFCVEDDTDEDVFVRLVSRLSGAVIEPAEFRLRRGGWELALRTAGALVRAAVHRGYDGALLAVDADGSEPHVEAHEAHTSTACRLCLLRGAADVAGLKLPKGRVPLFFFAVPVRCVETWLLLLRAHPFVGEPEAIGLDPAGRRLLKTWLYGTPSPTRDRMRAAARFTLEHAGAEDWSRLERSSGSYRQFARQFASTSVSPRG